MGASSDGQQAKILPSRLYIDICSSDLRGLQNAEVTKPALEDLKVCGTLVKDAVQLLGQVDVHLTQCHELRNSVAKASAPSSSQARCERSGLLI